MSLAHLWLWIPGHPAGESHWHPFKDLVVSQLHLEAWSRPVLHGQGATLRLVARPVHRAPFQPVLDLTDEPLFTAGDLVLLVDQKGRVSSRRP